MSILAFGINHKTAPVEFREKVAFEAHALAESLASLVSIAHVSEGVILSTCNRTEIYCHAQSSFQKNDIVAWLSSQIGRAHV